MLISIISEPHGGGHLPIAGMAPEPLRVFRNGGVIENRFASVGDESPPGSGAIIVSLKRFLQDKSDLLSRGGPLGVRLETSDSPEALKPDIARLALVEIHIPHFKDGRAFSLARQLRTRFGFNGEVRISGHYLIDQIAFFIRVGADSFVLAGNISPDEAGQAIATISNNYQPSIDGRPTIRDLRERQRPPS